MRFSVAAFTFLAALADVAFGQNSCGATAASCPTVRNNAASRSSCSSYFTQNSIKTSTCYTSTVITTKYNLTRTETSTFYSTTRPTLTSIRTITSNLGASTVTSQPTTTITVTETGYSTATTSTSTVVTTTTSYSTLVVVSTYTATITGSPPTTSSAGSVASTLMKFRKRQAATVPGDCSCFLFTSTVRTRAAYEFPTGTTTITISTTIVATSASTATSSTTLSVSGGVVTVTSWVASTVTSTQTLPTTAATETTTTITKPETTTSTSVVFEFTYVPPNAPDTTSCPGNAGLEVAIYDNPFRIAAGQPVPTNYNNFIPEYFKTSEPYGRNRTSDVGLDYDRDDVSVGGPNFHVYGMTAKVITYDDRDPGTEFVLNHRGYFYAPETTTYNFRIFGADDGAWLWVGQIAYTNWTRANANAYTIYNGTPNNNYEITLTAGSYTPFRIIYGNGLRFGHFSFEIKDTSGNFYAQHGTPSPYLVAFACDKPAEAPPFNPFGSETSQATGPPDTSCSNAGMEAAIFDNPYPHDGSQDYGNFVPERFKYASPSGEKVVSSIGIDWDTPNNEAGRHPYGWNPEQNPLLYAILWRGFFYAPKSGNYTFKVSRGDNFGGVWTDSLARVGWTRANAQATSIWYSGGFTQGQVTLNLVGGTYVPFRVITANGGGASRLNFDIVDGSQTYYVRSSTPSAYLVRFACDGSINRFSDPFGEES
ncbi:uncharacterized protein DFL_002043 [Arthrobotrys flagrans]|uniref:PA14 domain-containing protein n=1 Tax=Arthrobotrys flagrans TaxID=97331 RepID=A0A437A9K8_ARTFL|nr:hypothetical protein DFL_002043 [Arthrobotrys flagrans]